MLVRRETALACAFVVVPRHGSTWAYIRGTEGTKFA
jgi:hypothetical protein